MMPILYSFRRCPYAMRARLALSSSGQQVELRELKLRAKPPAFLEASLSATVPCLVCYDGAIDESLDIMKWALEQHDPEGWLDMPDDGWALIEEADGPFKHALDRVKYHTRYPDVEVNEQRKVAAEFLTRLDGQISGWIYAHPTLADFAILPFVRQFALIDKSWFDNQDWPDLQGWLEAFLSSRRFADIMQKYEPWSEGDQQVIFPEFANDIRE